VLRFGQSAALTERKLCESRTSATKYVVSSSRLDDLEPVGWLPFVVVGLKKEAKDGPALLQILEPDATDPTGALRYERPGDMGLLPIQAVIDMARLRPFDSDPRLRTPLLLGTVPGQWDFFPAWLACDRQKRPC